MSDMTGLKIKDVMTTTVVVAREDTPFKEIVRLMHEHRVSGLPVLDAEDRLVGMVTEADLLDAETEPEDPRGRRFIEWFIHPARLAEIDARVDDLRAADIMTPSVVTIDPEMTVRRGAKTLLDAGVKRLPVVDRDGRVVGIVSRPDLLRPFLRPDAEIAAEIRDRVILRTMWIDPAGIDVVVRDGVVRLDGRVDRRSVQEILIELVERVDGVVSVADELTYEWDDRAATPGPSFGGPRWSENWVARR